MRVQNQHHYSSSSYSQSSSYPNNALAGSMPNYNLYQRPHSSATSNSLSNCYTTNDFNDRDSKFSGIKPLSFSSFSSSSQQLSTAYLKQVPEPFTNDIEYKGTRSIFNSKYRQPQKVKNEIEKQLEAIQEQSYQKGSQNSYLDTKHQITRAKHLHWQQNSILQKQLHRQSCLHNDDENIAFYNQQLSSQLKTIIPSSFENNSESMMENYSQFTRINGDRMIFSDIPKSPLSSKEIFSLPMHRRS